MSEARRLRGLEEENQRLKRLVAEQALDIQVLKEVPEKTGKARRTPLGRALCHRCAWLFRAAGLSANDGPSDGHQPRSRRRIAHPSAWSGRGTSALRQPTVADPIVP